MDFGVAQVGHLPGGEAREGQAVGLPQHTALTSEAGGPSQCPWPKHSPLSFQVYSAARTLRFP